MVVFFKCFTIIYVPERSDEPGSGVCFLARFGRRDGRLGRLQHQHRLDEQRREEAGGYGRLGGDGGVGDAEADVQPVRGQHGQHTHHHCR